MAIKINIRTSVAFIFTGFKPAAQFGTYATWLTIGLGAYIGKRLIQKRKEFNGGIGK